MTGELRTLVTIEAVWLPYVQGTLQDHEAEARIQSVRQLPGEHAAAVPVEDGDQIEKTAPHWHIGDVCALDLVGPHNGQVAQQIGIALRHCSRLAQPRLGIDRLQAYLPQEPTNPLVIDGVPLLLQPGGHTANAVEGRPRILLVQQAHQRQVRCTLAARLVVPTGTRHPEQLAWAHNAQLGVLRLNQLPPLPPLPGQGRPFCAASPVRP